MLTPMTSAGVSMTVANNIGQQVNTFKCLPGSIPPKYLPGSCK